MFGVIITNILISLFLVLKKIKDWSKHLTDDDSFNLVKWGRIQSIEDQMLWRVNWYRALYFTFDKFTQFPRIWFIKLSGKGFQPRLFHQQFF